MKKLAALILALTLILGTAAALTSCKTNTVTIAVPNDTTNEARALLLLEAQGLIKLKDGAGITATVLDIVENPYNIEFVEIEAAQLPRQLKDVDFAIINSNYAIEAGLNPTSDSVAIENSYSAYSNIISVKAGNENTDITKALVAAVSSQAVKDYITTTYGGNIISVVENPTNGYDTTVNYEALAGQTIKIAASPTPHAEILEIAKTILSEKNITLDIRVFDDYVQPNLAVEDGEVYANYFQHVPYMDDFNAENNTHIVSVLAVHVEPMGIYSESHKSLDEIKK